MTTGEIVFRLVGLCVACFAAFQWGQARGERIALQEFNRRMDDVLSRAARGQCNEALRRAAGGENGE